MQKAKDRYHNYGKEKATKYCIANKEFLKENTKKIYRNLSEGEKEVKKEFGTIKYTNVTGDKEQVKRISKKL